MTYHIFLPLTLHFPLSTAHGGQNRTRIPGTWSIHSSNAPAAVLVYKGKIQKMGVASPSQTDALAENTDGKCHENDMSRNIA